MKKAVALLLGLMLVLSFALVACGDEATDTEDTSATTAAADTETSEAADTGGPVDWTEASDYEESEATITGTVAAVDNLYEIKGIAKLLIRLGGDSSSDHFNAVLVLNADGTLPEYAAEYADMAAALVGQTVEVTGVVTINSFESCYEILLNDADNNTLPDDAMTGTLTIVQ